MNAAPLALNTELAAANDVTTPRTIEVNRPYLPEIRALCRNCDAEDNVPSADPQVAEGSPVTCRFFPRRRAIARCVLLHRDGFARHESLRGVLAEPVLNRRESLSFC